MSDNRFEKPEIERLKNLKIRDGSVTPLLTKMSFGRPIPIILQNRPSQFEQIPPEPPFLPEFSLEFSFGLVKTRVLDFTKNDQLLKSFAHLASPIQLRKTQEKLIHYWDKTFQFQYQVEQTKIKRPKIVHRKRNNQIAQRIEQLHLEISNRVPDESWGQKYSTKLTKERWSKRYFLGDQYKKIW